VVTAGWVAPCTRGRALLDRTIGDDGARAIAAAPAWEEARTMLAATAYGRDLAVDASREAARRSASTAMVWQIRVLAGWLPPGATGLARLAVAPVEIGNIEGHLAELRGGDPERAVALGPLAVAWPRIAVARSEDEVQQILTRSVWGDPGAGDAVSIAVGLRVAWARRVLRAAPIARPWAMGGLAVLVARELLVFDRQLDEVVAHEVDRLLTRGWRTASSVPELADRLADSASWVLADIEHPDELWRAELRLIRRVVADSTPVAATGRFGRDTVVAIAALIVADLWRVTAAIEAVGANRSTSKVFDAVAA
jgi:hypothetical protein